MRSASAFIALTLACGPSEGATSSFTTTPTSSTTSGPTTAEPASTGDGSGSTDGTSTSSSGHPATTSGDPSTSTSTADASTTLVLDVGSDKDLGDGTPAGCKGKIDFLFVISRQLNMGGIQAQLVDAFPKFMSTIESKFEDFDYHIMVVDTDDYWGLPWQCTPVCPDLSCKKGEPCCMTEIPKGEICCPVPDYPCGDLGLVTACDKTLGAGTVFPAGGDASNEPCKLDGGRRYLTKGQASPSEAFSCIAQVGIGGSNQVGAALAAAVAPEINAAGGCNEGFLRDDALLMVTLVTPGSDDSYSGTVEEWYQGVVAAKKGDAEAVVMFVLGNPACPDYDQPCELAKMFSHVSVASNDAADYGPAFEEATAIVEGACEALVPQ